ncbi:MAG: ACT domain-containing protein [Melioribacteraceae bacterium]|nr:ACT domain-containing protein [Melioribacteraceae bacterium]MCF8356579.1 ACT domain-containing protein [Melioribacteraceae bacterium]MCF8395982.1 ACT domain-containing protein [Melioribacteraceae bacterium]MCF8421033.1 ACT domain-containing protein [Melioribacteraceae bacterium]
MKLKEDELRRLTLMAIEELGDKASPELVKNIVTSTVNKLSGEVEKLPVSEDKTSGRIILTAFGLNATGIVASITSALSEYGCDIQDLTQKLMGDFFTMIMVVDITDSDHDLRQVQEKMNEISGKLGIKVFLQHEDLFRQMHRI